MKRLFLLALCSLAVHAAFDVSLVGKWQVHIKIADREVDQTCTFAPKGSDLSGSCTSAAGAATDIAGKIEDSRITWTWKTNSENGPVTLNYRGALNAAGDIVGSVNVVEYGVEGEFTAVQAK